jgi:MFS family permease
VQTAPPTAAPAPRKLSLRVIFLTLYIDLIGFSIIFPLGPDLIAYYVKLEGHGGLLGWFLAQTDTAANWFGHDTHFVPVLIGGVLSSLFSVLQFMFAPFWGSWSDRRGRRGVLLLTVAGTAFGYLLWACSGSFWLFVLSRLLCGGFSGNLSVATAAVADVTSREERSKAMGLVGAAFGLGLITGPMIGALTAHFDLLAHFPGLARFGINPFSVPALLSLAFSLLNLFWIRSRFAETLTDSARAASREPRIRNPVREIFALDQPAVRSTNLVGFIYSMAFVGMEATLTFLAAERFGYTARQNGILLVFLGMCSVLMQGVIVRRVLKHVDEVKVLGVGLLFSSVGLLAVGLAPTPLWLYLGLTVLAIGSGLVNPASTGLISLYCGADEQGRVLGIFRSLGALARAITPICAGLAFWIIHAPAAYAIGTVLTLVAFALSVRLPRPVK